MCIAWCALVGASWSVGVHCLVCVGLVRVGRCTLVGGRWCALLEGAGPGRGGRAGRRRRECKLKTKNPLNDVGKKHVFFCFHQRIPKKAWKKQRTKKNSETKTSPPRIGFLVFGRWASLVVGAAGLCFG